MTPRERLLAILRGQAADRIPWSPNPAYWWEAQTDEFTQRGELEFLKSIGADPLFRGHYPQYGKYWEEAVMYKYKYRNTCIREIKNGDEIQKIYDTPVGKLELIYKYSRSGNTTFLSRHGVNEKEDFKVLTYLFEDIEIEADYRRYKEAACKLGDDGLIVPMLTPNTKSAFQLMLEIWAGTESLVYAVLDYPEAVEEALDAMKRVSAKAVSIAAGSDAEAFITWEDTSTTNISPSFYKKYILPEINEWCDELHENGKLYIQHACGHLQALLPLMANAKIDCIESISPPPTGNIELWEARKILPPHIALIGGIEPTVFLNSSAVELRDYAGRLLEKMAGTRFVLANSDSCPPGVTLEKFVQLGKWFNK